MTTPHETAQDVHRLAEEVKRLARALDAALACQWEAPPIPRPREDTTERAKGGPPADPTADVALDERRLEVRASIKQARHSLATATDTLAAAAAYVEAAVSAWQSD